MEVIHCQCGSCKTCKRRLYHREYGRRRRQNPEFLAVQRQRSVDDRARLRDLGLPARGEEDPQKKRARQAVTDAIRSGELKKPRTCSRCGDEPEPRLLEAHHEDYALPLEVVWLCHRCHKIQDRLRDD